MKTGSAATGRDCAGESGHHVVLRLRFSLSYPIIQTIFQENHIMTLDNFRNSTAMLLLLCLFVLGCSKNVKVSGTVTYSDTNEVVKFGTVIFTGEKEVGRGVINNGKYSVGLINDGDGIPPGTYTIAADSPWTPLLPTLSILGPDGKPVQLERGSQERELYYTKEPQTIEIKKSMTYDFQVERDYPPN
jgi:hypothetical protein